MKTKTVTTRRPIRENRNIPDFMVRHVAEECSDALKKLMVNNVNASVNDPTERRKEIVRMSVVLKDLTDDIKNLLDESLNKFLNRSTR